MSNEVNYRQQWAEGEIEAGTLLDAIDTLEAECERLTDELDRRSVIQGDCIARCQRLADERDALAAELAAIRAAGGEAKVVAWMLADAVGGSMLEFQRELLLQDQCRHGGELVPLCDQRIVAAMAAELGDMRELFLCAAHSACLPVEADAHAVVDSITGMQRTIAELRAELEAARKQEPVAVVEYTGYEPANSLRWLNEGLAYIEPGTELYSAPICGTPAAYTTQGMLDIAKELPLTGRIGARCRADERWNVPLYTLPPLAGQVSVPEGWLIELGFDVLDKPFRFVDSKSHTPTIKVILPACEVDESSAWDLRDEVAARISALLATPGMEVKHEA